MNAKTVSTVVGIFSVLNTIQFFIFELKQPRYVGFEDKYSIYVTMGSETVTWVLDNRQKMNICLSVTTLLVSSFLLFCIYKSIFLGLLTYALWIAAYELVHFSLVVIMHGAIKEQFKDLTRIYLLMQVSRMLLHFSSLPYVLKHGYHLYKTPKSISKTARHRRASISTMDSWQPGRMGMIYRR